MKEQASRERILLAAEAEFLANGYDRSRMQAIADRAGINKAMLHYYFGSKEELFAAIVREKIQSLFPKIEASIRSHGDFIAFTCDFVDLYHEFLLSNPYLPFYILQVSTNHLELLQQLPADVPHHFMEAFTAAVKRGAIQPHDPRQFLISLLGMCWMPFVGRNLMQHMIKLNDDAFNVLVKTRAEEIKRYVVLILTPKAKHRKGK